MIAGGAMPNTLDTVWNDQSGIEVTEYFLGAAVVLAILLAMKALCIHPSDVLADVGIR
jgi:hypothetical protein